MFSSERFYLLGMNSYIHSHIVELELNNASKIVNHSGDKRVKTRYSTAHK